MKWRLSFRVIKLGADDYITKPFDSEVLLLKIKAILKRNDELNKESEKAEFDLSATISIPNFVSSPMVVLLKHCPQGEWIAENADWISEWLCSRNRHSKRSGEWYYFNGRSMDVHCQATQIPQKNDPGLRWVNITGEMDSRLVVHTFSFCLGSVSHWTMPINHAAYKELKPFQCRVRAGNFI